MTRRGGQLPWGTRGSRSVYDTGHQTPVGRLLVLGAIVLGVVLLGAYVVMNAFGGSCSDEYCPADEDLAPPEGYERVTKVYAYNEDHGPLPEGQPLQIALPLTERTPGGTNLNFFRYVPEGDRWEPLGAAAVDVEGKTASATLPSAPRYVAVLRRLSEAGHVVAYLPPGVTTLHPDAVGKVTILHTRDYAPSSDGTIQGSRSDINPGQGVEWYPSIWADGSTQGMIPIVSTILATPESRSKHVQDIVRVANEGAFEGIDIAYLDLPPTERTNFTLFVAELAGELHKQNKKLSLTLPVPQKTPAQIDEGAYDWEQLGKSADILQIAPFREQGKFRQVMPEILQYLTERVDPKKLVLTVSPYAVETSADGIQVMTLADAMAIATRMSLVVGNENRVETNSNVQVVGVNIDRNENLTGVSWSTDAASVFFTYKQGSGRTVYIENFFSLGFKLELIPRFGLGGVAVEDASGNEYLGNIWTALNPFIATGQPVLMQPNADDLAPKWFVSDGSSEGGNQGVIRWATPSEPGTYTVRLTLSDGVALFQNEMQVQVQAKQTSTPAAGG